MEKDSDAIRRCLEGDTNAFRVLVERYEREALSHAHAIVGSREDSRDLVQEAFLDAFRALHAFDCAREFYPWFYVVLRNRCYRWLKSQTRRITVRSDASNEFLADESVVGERFGEIEEALHGLSAADRELLLLKYVDGLSYQALAERLDIPIGTVMSRLYHARRRLREKVLSDAN